jgi:hypothetical protein
MSYRKHITLKTDDVEVELRETWIDPDNDVWAWKVYLIDPQSKMLTEQGPGDGIGMPLPRALIVAASCLANPGKPTRAQKYLDAACACAHVPIT